MRLLLGSGLAVVPALALVWAGCGSDDLVLPTPFDSGVRADRIAPPEASDDGGSDGGIDAPAGDASVIVGAKDRILLSGTIVTPDQIIVGQVLVEKDKITCVAPGTGCAGEPGASGATIVETGGVISPGLIDTHNHILFDVFDDSDWLPLMPYQDHDQWPNEARYQAMLDVKQCLANDSQGKPTWCANTPYGNAQGSLRCELDKWGELKGLIAGTTSIVGLPGTSAACFGSLARSVDVSQNGLGSDKIQTSAIFPPSNATGVCANFASKTTDAFLVHCGEGLDAKALAEFTTLGSGSTPPGCLYAPQTTITHGAAFTPAEFAKMGAAGMKLTWSPKSNVALYGKTADLPAALDAGVLVAIAPDWSMGGSQNLLDELRFADDWDNKNFGNRLTTQDLVTMATKNAAKVLALGGVIGTIEKGAMADLTVFTGNVGAPYDAIVAATPRQVRLVMVGGVALYGDLELAAIAPAAPGCETLDICQSQKFLCVATTDKTNKLDQSYSAIKGALDKAMTDVDTQTPNDGWNFAPLAPLVKCN
jgi:hypothetical protein